MSECVAPGGRRGSRSPAHLAGEGVGRTGGLALRMSLVCLLPPHANGVYARKPHHPPSTSLDAVGFGRSTGDFQFLEMSGKLRLDDDEAFCFQLVARIYRYPNVDAQPFS